MKPTVGRIVFYWPPLADGATHGDKDMRAAVVTYVHSDTMVNMHVFGQDLADKEAGVQTSVEIMSGDRQGYCWSWPPRN